MLPAVCLHPAMPTRSMTERHGRVLAPSVPASVVLTPVLVGRGHVKFLNTASGSILPLYELSLRRYCQQWPLHWQCCGAASGSAVTVIRHWHWQVLTGANCPPQPDSSESGYYSGWHRDGRPGRRRRLGVIQVATAVPVASCQFELELNLNDSESVCSLRLTGRLRLTRSLPVTRRPAGVPVPA